MLHCEVGTDVSEQTAGVCDPALVYLTSDLHSMFARSGPDTE